MKPSSNNRISNNILFLLPFLLTASGGDIDFTRSYFLNRDVHQLAMITCWNITKRVEFLHELMPSNLRISFASLSEEVDLPKFLKVNYYKLGVVLDLDCLSGYKILHQVSKYPLFFNESYFWLMTSSTEIPESILRALPLSINAELTIALRQLNSYVLYDVYNPSYRHGGKLNVTYLGEWNRHSGYRLAFNQYKYKRRGNLNGMYINFSIVMDYRPNTVDVATYLTTPIERHLDSMHRFHYALTRQLRDYYNFTINLSRGTTWGYLQNGTFNGIVGDMVKGIVDVGATPFQFKSERLDVIEYTVETWIARPTMIFRHPKSNALNNHFFKPLEKGVWWVSSFFAVVIWLSLYVSVIVERRMLYDDTCALNNTFKAQPASNTFLITTAAICQQGLNEGPRLISGRLIFISLFLWTMIVYQFYSASIVGSLLTPSPRFIKTLKDLSDSTLEVGIEDIAYNYDFFRTTTDPVAIELYNRKVAPGKKKKRLPYFTPEEGLRRVKKGDFAFQVDVSTAYKIITDTFTEDEICDLQEIQLFPPKSVAAATSKNSPFKKMVSYGFRQIMERGMGNRLRHIWHHPCPKCPENHSSLPTPVPFNEFSPVLIMLVTGVAVSIFIMLIEYVIHKSTFIRYIS